MAAALLVLVGLGGGLWLNHREPKATLVSGTPVAVSLNSAASTHDAAFIARLIRDINGGELCPEYGCVGSCIANPILRQDRLRFEYANGDKLAVQVNSGCGSAVVGIPGPDGDRLTHPAWNSAVLDDLNNWPTAS
jgi:hypothetical protein